MCAPFDRDRTGVHYSVGMEFVFPKVYPILDSARIPREDRAAFLHQLATSLAKAGVALLEYRNKTGAESEILSDASILRAAMPETRLILDDRVDLVDQTRFDGVHVDSGDQTADEARQILGPNRIIGTFGGSEDLVTGILQAQADYLSIGPIAHTTTKQTTKPPIGAEGVRRLREQAGPAVRLIAVGGVTLEMAPLLIAAGATAVAVAAAIFGSANPAGEFERWKQAVG